MEIITECLQNSPEWMKLRVASIGGSTIGKLAPKGKQYANELYRFAGELMTGVKAESPSFKFADRGHEQEPIARDYYSFINECEVWQPALVKGEPHKHYSPDGLVGDDGIIEIKTRIPSIFVEASDKGYFPIDVRRQIQWGLHICERWWCDYIQFCGEMAEAGENPMLVLRCYRDEKIIKELDETANQFIEEVYEIVERIRGLA